MEILDMKIITGFKDGVRVYYAEDVQSGGYPYWSTSLSDAVPASDNFIEEIQRDFINKKGYSYSKDVETPQVSEICFKDESIDLNPVIINKVQEAIGRISEEDMEILIEAGIFK
jgi:hypothetical protein